jgi:mannose-6-phosphate isomerase-like protein (cupin superfamily)
MTVISSASAPTFEQDGTFVTGLASPSRGSREVAAWRLRLAAGAASPEHMLTHEEVFVALSGRAVATQDGGRHDVGPGDALVVTPGVPFVLANEGDEPFEAVVAMRCGGLAQVGDERFAPPWAE